MSTEPNGSFFISKPETEIDEAFDIGPLMALHPDYYGPRFDAIADLRNQDDGSLHRRQGFRRVASFVNVPLFQAATTLLDPEFMKNKKKFYAWLRRNREYCTYDIKSHTLAPAGTTTFIDGKAV
jgi:hypothetical protein